MARSDRLMRLMDVLRRLPAPVTAARLAAETGVSPRQMYRDIATLRAGGALIDGEAGLGYTLTEDGALPPQSFSRLEIEALLLAVSALDGIADADLLEAARAAMARIVATLPGSQSGYAHHATLHAFIPRPERAEPTIDMDLVRRACWEEFGLDIAYRDLSGRHTTREIWPLGMSYAQDSLMLLGFCRLRRDFRVFHLNRMIAAAPSGTSFRPRRVSLLRDYMAQRRVRSSATKDAAPSPSR